MPQPESGIHSFPTLPNDFKSAAELVQSQFKEGISALDERIRELETEQRRRNITAIVLKVVSVISSLIVLSGVAGGMLVQVLGGAITGIAALERVFANMSKLMAVAAAVAAYQRLRMQVVAQHNREIIEVIKYRDRDPAKSADALISFVGKLRDAIAEIREKIESDLRSNAYENLGRLVLEEQKSSEI